jgi:hypothetical protein
VLRLSTRYHRRAASVTSACRISFGSFAWKRDQTRSPASYGIAGLSSLAPQDPSATIPHPADGQGSDRNVFDPRPSRDFGVSGLQSKPCAESRDRVPASQIPAFFDSVRHRLWYVSASIGEVPYGRGYSFRSCPRYEPATLAANPSGFWPGRGRFLARMWMWCRTRG